MNYKWDIRCLLGSLALKAEALYFSETSVNFYHTPRHHIAENNTLYELEMFGNEIVKKVFGRKRTEVRRLLHIWFMCLDNT
jgi:hypothetical protein